MEVNRLYCYEFCWSIGFLWFFRLKMEGLRRFGCGFTVRKSSEAM